jgi:hypothetical protein
MHHYGCTRNTCSHHLAAAGTLNCIHIAPHIFLDFAVSNRGFNKDMLLDFASFNRCFNKDGPIVLQVPAVAIYFYEVARVHKLGMFESRCLDCHWFFLYGMFGLSLISYLVQVSSNLMFSIDFSSPTPHRCGFWHELI